jgi:hypothetical protein
VKANFFIVFRAFRQGHESDVVLPFLCDRSGHLKTGTSKPAGRAPPGALLFVSRQKVSKKRLPLQGALLSRGPE